MKTCVLCLNVLAGIIFLAIIIAVPPLLFSRIPNYELGLSETRLVHFNTYLFESWKGGSIKIDDVTPIGEEDNSTNLVQLMRFSKKPALSVVDSWSSQLPSNLTSMEYFYWSWFLNRNSTLEVSWQYYKDQNATQNTQKEQKGGKGKEKGEKRIARGRGVEGEGIEIWGERIKGEEEMEKVSVYLVASDNGYFGFTHWMANKSGYPSKYVKYNSSSGSNFSYTIPTNDFYYLFFLNYNPESVTGQINFNVSSTLYDVSNPDETCNLPCSMSLPFIDQGETLMLVSPRVNSYVQNGTGSANAYFEFTAHLRLRYWLILTTVPVIIVLFCICHCKIYFYACGKDCTYFCCCNNTTNKEKNDGDVEKGRGSKVGRCLYWCFHIPTRLKYRELN
eukprot:Phypoly_transcript_11468.p1 GENE.Phypoly_transcript_11468~~Phypoly_transcript_11468.p1  ORF type:complete len:401 (+),score=43.62 Phypoly_transcript_11468:36-1205(+)